MIKNKKISLHLQLCVKQKQVGLDVACDIKVLVV